MDRESLKTLRQGLGLTQAEMAKAVGMTRQGYQRVEAGEAPLKRTLALAAERVALARAAAQGQPMLAPAAVRREALLLAQLVTGEGI